MIAITCSQRWWMGKGRTMPNEFPCGSCRSAGPGHDPTCPVLLAREPAVKWLAELREEERVTRQAVEVMAEGFSLLPLGFVREIADGNELAITAIKYTARKVAEARERVEHV